MAGRPGRRAYLARNAVVVGAASTGADGFDAAESPSGTAAESGSTPDASTLAQLSVKVEILWAEREALLRESRPYKITYQCKECGTVIEALHPKFRAGDPTPIVCPKHGGRLTEMDYTA